MTVLDVAARESEADPAGGMGAAGGVGHMGRAGHVGSGGPPPVEIVRSPRRRKTLTARRVGGSIVVRVPAGMRAADERRHVDALVARVLAREGAGRPGEEALMARALHLSERFLDGAARPTSVLWSSRQHSRWASCTSATGVIRVSNRLRAVPPWVLDAVLVHELAHLLEANHSPRFWRLALRCPDTERARDFLAGYALGLEERSGLSTGDG